MIKRIISLIFLIAVPLLSQPNWQPVQNQQYNMQVIGYLYWDEVKSNNSNDIIGAFVGEECRGIANPQAIPGSEGIFFLTITSNIQNGEIVIIKAFNSNENHIDEIVDSLIFQSALEIGSFDTPADFYAKLPILLPLAPELTSPTNSSINISLTPNLDWNSSSDAESYELQVSESEQFTSSVINQNGLTNTEYSVPTSALSYSKKYYWRVRAVNTAGNSDWSTVWNFTTEAEPIPIPSVPQLVAPADNDTNISLTPILDWNSSSDAVTYELQVSTSEQFGSTVLSQSELTATEYNVEASVLSYSTEYFWRVRAVNTTGNSGWSTVWKFTTAAEPIPLPGVPQLVAPANNATNISLIPIFDWNSSPDAVTYELQVSESDQFTSTIINQSGLTNTEYSVSASVLNYSTEYHWRVRAVNTTGNSDWSTVWNFTVIDFINSPSNLEGTVQPGKINLTWEDKSNNENYFIIEREKAGLRSFEIIDSVQANVTNYSDELIESNTNYSYRVKAVNDNVESGYTNTLNILSFNTNIIAPASLTAVQLSPGILTVNIMWSIESDNHSGFILERKENESSYLPIAELGETVNEYEDNEIEFGKNYTYRIKAHLDNLYFSDYSNTAVVEVVIPVELTMFSSIQDDDNIILTWETASELNNLGFEVQTLVNNIWEKIGFVEGNGTTTEIHQYSFNHKIRNLRQENVKFRLMQIDYDGSFIITEAIEQNIQPFTYELLQNYPNPFNPSTTIEFSTIEKQLVTLEVFNILGQSIEILLNNEIDGGFHKVQFNGYNLPSGVYYFRLTAGDFVSTKKMLLIK
ncbi:MAG: T9SS type A sorting domain-containing protein [Melioribacteraceae bacterium]|nr:T9SS type A sorting domain-containing protein [Melioribacteraceae bacterium]